MEDFRTGDILLFSYRGFKSPIDILSYLIEWFSPLPYSHCGIYLKDPHFLHVGLKGEYVWESVINNEPDLEDGEIKYGVKITPLEEYINTYNGTISIRRVLKDNKPVEFTEEQLSDIQKIVYGKPYDIDPMDWVRELMRCKDPDPQKVTRFWCSAFVGCFLTKIGVLNKKTDWSILKPCEFAMNNLHFNIGYSMGDTRLIKK